MEPVPDLSKGRARKVWIWAGAGLVMLSIAAVAWWAMRRGSRVEARRRVGEAWARFERCLIGPPLAPGESADERVRRIWLAAPARPVGLNDKDREALWPNRCARYLDAARSDIPKARMGDRVRTVFERALEAVGGAGEPGTYSSFATLFRELAAAGVPLGADARVPFPGEPVHLFRRADLRPLARGAVVSWARREGSAWRFLLDGRNLCEVDLSAAAGSCAPLAFVEGADAHVSLAGGEPGAPPVAIVSKPGNEGVYEVGPVGANGQRPVERLAGGARGAYGRGHGAVDLLAGDRDHGHVLVRIRGGKERERIPLAAVGRGATVELIDDSIVWMAAPAPGGGPGRILRLPLPPSGGLGAVEQLGELWPGDDIVHLRGCGQGDTHGVLASFGAQDYLVVRGKGAWGKPQPIDAERFPMLSCREAGVVLTWGALQRVRCTNAECVADGRTLSLDQEDPREHFEAVGADVGERGVVAQGIGHSLAPRQGGVRLRVGPIDSLGDVTPRVVVDDAYLDHGGIDPLRLYLFGGPDFGLLIAPEAGDDHGVYAFRVAPDGTVTPVVPQ